MLEHQSHVQHHHKRASQKVCCASLACIESDKELPGKSFGNGSFVLALRNPIAGLLSILNSRRQLCFGTRASMKKGWAAVAGHTCEEIILAGGLAKNRVWLQMRANATRKPVVVSENTGGRRKWLVALVIRSFYQHNQDGDIRNLNRFGQFKICEVIEGGWGLRVSPCCLRCILSNKMNGEKGRRRSAVHQVVREARRESKG